MGMNYNFVLGIGFVVDYDIVDKIFHKDGKFQCDLLIDDKYKIGCLSDLINETNILQDKFNCLVSTSFDFDDSAYDSVFFGLNIPKSPTKDFGKASIRNTEIPVQWIIENQNKLNELKEKLERELKTTIGQAKIFIESNIG